MLSNNKALDWLGDHRFHFIQYESLVLRPRIELHILSNFLKISYEPETMLSLNASSIYGSRFTANTNLPQKHNTKHTTQFVRGTHDHIRYSQIMNPLKKSQHYHLSLDEKQKINVVGCGMLRFFGYEYDGAVIQNFTSIESNTRLDQSVTRCIKCQ